MSQLRRRLVENASAAIPEAALGLLGSLSGQVAAMEAAEEDATREGALVHVVPWAERAAGEQVWGWACFSAGMHSVAAVAAAAACRVLCCSHPSRRHV